MRIIPEMHRAWLINVRGYRRGGGVKKGQSRETGNIRYTRRRKKGKNKKQKQKQNQTQKTKTQHNRCWTPLYVNKHK